MVVVALISEAMVLEADTVRQCRPGTGNRARGVGTMCSAVPRITTEAGERLTAGLGSSNVNAKLHLTHRAGDPGRPARGPAAPPSAPKGPLPTPCQGKGAVVTVQSVQTVQTTVNVQ